LSAMSVRRRMRLRIHLLAPLVTATGLTIACSIWPPDIPPEEQARRREEYLRTVSEASLAERVDFSFDGRTWVEVEPTYAVHGFERHYVPSGQPAETRVEEVTVAYYFPNPSRHTIHDVLQYKRRDLELRCGAIAFEVVREEPTRALVEWNHGRCPASGAGTASSIAVFLRGGYGFHHLTYSYSGPSIPARNKRAWRSILRKARVVEGAA
jgi:hypothetical protein